MTAQPDPQHEIDGDVYVSPRYLASTTGFGGPALAPLLDLGWSIEHDDLGNGYINAPDRRVRVGYLPEGDDDGLWRINAYRDPFGPPTWGACFNDGTPTEFVTAFTTALATAYEQGPGACLARPVAGIEERDPFRTVKPLLDQGWVLDQPRRKDFAIQAPDGLAALEYTRGPLDRGAELTTRDARWQLWAGKSIDRPAWYATFSTDTPVAVLTAVTECVADPAPLPRWRQATFSYVKELARLTPILPPAPPAPHRSTYGGPSRPAAQPRPRSQRSALEHHQPLGAARPPPVGPAPPEPETHLSLQAAEFFAELCLPFHDCTTVGNTYFAAPNPSAPLRLRIDFAETIHADTYSGLRVAVVHPDHGEIDAVFLSFLDHQTFHRRDEATDRRPNTKGYATFDKYHLPGRPPWEGAVTTGLRDAIEQYVAVWFPGAWAARRQGPVIENTVRMAPGAPVANVARSR